MLVTAVPCPSRPSVESSTPYERLVSLISNRRFNQGLLRNYSGVDNGDDWVG